MASVLDRLPLLNRLPRLANRWRPERAETLRAGPSAVRAGREAVERHLAHELDEATLRELKLLVSELVTNAVRHSPTERVRVEVATGDDCARVRVCDEGAGFDPGRVEPDPDPCARPGGFGLVLVDRLARRWGVDRNGGTCVWFELDRVRPGRDAATAMR